MQKDTEVLLLLFQRLLEGKVLVYFVFGLFLV